MNPIKNLLLAVDFTDHSSYTLQSTIQFAKESQCTISLVHVIMDFRSDDSIVDKESSDKLDEVVRKILAEKIVVSNVKLVHGNIDDEVIAYAEEIHADAIVIGSGNYHKSNKHRLGGVAEAILRQSHIPVLIIKNFYSRHNKIACPIDLSNTSKSTLLLAIEYAQHIQGELVIIHSVEPATYGYPGSSAGYLGAESSFYENESKAFDIFLEGIDFKNLKWSKKLLFGTASLEISEYLSQNSFSLVIMRSAARAGLSRLILGSVAESVTKNTACPCLIVKKYE